MSPVARSRQAHAFSTEKKKKNYRESENPTITSLAEKSNRWQRKHTPMPDTAYRANQTQQQTKLNSKPNTEHTERNTENTERQRFLSKKKNPQYTNKNQTWNPSKPTVTSQRCHSSLVVAVDARPSSQIRDRPLLRCSLRPSLKVFLSFSLSLYLTVTKMKNETKFL